MWKHILVQGTFQIIVIMILIFAGETFLPEENATNAYSGIKSAHVLENTVYPGYVAAGRPYQLNGEPLYRP